uniref:HYDIN/VesB/CFA65-like Ig-like domain-containing protein n=1 Tax=Salarias fasciatus TaxID=181472 RepID=A0A672JGY3_SALFA
MVVMGMIMMMMMMMMMMMIMAMMVLMLMLWLQVTPSVFTQEILQSTEERLSNSTKVRPPRVLEWLDIGDVSHHKLSLVDLEQPIFQPYPSELVFQNFLPAQTYMIPLLLLNNDKVSRRVKLEQQDSEYFHVDAPKEGNKVAPGLSATFTVYFTPQENKDYHHSLVFSTERERFEIPVCAIGPRAILDFRDRIELPLCPVKASTEKTHLVRNIGNSTANFQLLTQRPFSVTPTSGTLEIGDSMQVTVEFHPMTAGDHWEDLLLHYHTGENVYISLFGSCEELNVHLQPDSVRLNKTFISLASVRTVSLTNDSETSLQYCWTAGPIQPEESLSSLRESSVLQHMEKLQCESNPSAVLRSQELSSQTTEDLLLLLQEFSNNCITVEPAEGLIWPNMTRRFSVIFKPEEAKLYQQTIYCDVTGRQSPLPLRIQGEGIGPELCLNYNMMNMKNVYIGSPELYKVQLMNNGLIKAPFRWSAPDTTFGRCFTFQPEEGVVPPGASQTVEIGFQSRSLGSFCEDLLLIVTGQPQPLVMNFRGCVIGPNFHFNVSEINFGDVAFGFPMTYICTLFNPSFVPMNFSLRVLGDGLGPPSVTADRQVADETLKTWRGHTARELHTQPAEFTVSPATGSVRALSDINVKATLCSNTVGRYRLALVVDVEGVGEEVMTIPINARSDTSSSPDQLQRSARLLRHT